MFAEKEAQEVSLNLFIPFGHFHRYFFIPDNALLTISICNLQFRKIFSQAHIEPSQTTMMGRFCDNS